MVPRSLRGFTLLETALALLVGGMIAVTVTMVQTPALSSCHEATQQELRHVQDAVTRFVGRTGYLPLPAASNLGVNQPLFGRAVTSSGDTSIDTLPSGVVMGALPSVTLGLEDRYAADCWGNKFTYLVTAALTTADGMADPGNSGAIIIQSGILSTPAELTSPGERAAYAIISHGEDALGASALNYVGVKKNCNTQQSNSSIRRIDKENCDTNNATLFSSPFNSGNSEADFFDDLLAFAGKNG